MEDFKSIMLAHKGQFMNISFLKKDGTLRTINGQIGHKAGHDGKNTVQHIDKYVTMIENTKDGSVKFRNVNINTIQRLAVGGRVYIKEN